MERSDHRRVLPSLEVERQGPERAGRVELPQKYDLERVL